MHYALLYSLHSSSLMKRTRTVHDQNTIFVHKTAAFHHYFLHTSLHPNGTIFPQKYAITSSNIYRPNSLLSAVEYGNMSDTKEATA